MIAADHHLRRLLTGVASACFAIVFVAIAILERPGLGLTHFFYVPIILIAIVYGPTVGALTGLGTSFLYPAGVLLNSHLPTSSITSAGTAIRAVNFVLVGWLIGYYATRSRGQLGRADELAHELRTLARRDFVTGLPNQRAFEIAINGRIASGLSFVLVICDLPAAPPRMDERAHALGFGERLSQLVDTEAGVDVARIGNDQFAVVFPAGDDGAAHAWISRIEQALATDGRRGTVGWSTFPRDAQDALGLYTAAEERLYARKIARGEWEPSPGTVSTEP